MGHTRIGRRWFEQSLVRLASVYGVLHSSIDLHDHALRAVLPVCGLVLALDDGEGVHDVGHGVAGRGEGAGEGLGLMVPLVLRAEVEVEEGGVQLAPQQEAALLVPAEGRAIPAAVVGEGLQVPGCVGEFENAG